MASTTPVLAAAGVSPRPLRLPWWAPVAVALLAVLVYAVGYDQGLLLEPVLGKAASSANYLHEFFHDARHQLGFPCH